MTKVTVEAFAEGCRRLAPAGWREVRGCVVGKNCPKRYIRRMLAEGSSREAIENTFNHTHVPMLLSSFDSKDFDWKDARVIAEAYARMLLGSLAQKYPERQFVVEVLGEEDDMIIVCHQAEPEDVEGKGVEAACPDTEDRVGEQEENLDAE